MEAFCAMITLLSLHILLVACLVSVMCAIPGVFLVLRSVAMMSDAISHAILPGIVLMFFWVGNLESPLLLVGAAIAGIATVLATELLMSTNQLKKDAAIGLVFPFFFSIGVILISMYARTVHLDVDMVLLGELIFAPFNRMVIAGYDVGSYALWSTSILIIGNLILTKLFFKEITLSIFDPQLALLAGFFPQLLYYGLMIITSITAVTAFNIVGSFVVVALMIAPAATASLFTHSVKQMLIASTGISLLAAINGYTAAYVSDVSITGSIAVCNGLLFVIALLIAPHKGLMSRITNHYKNIKAKQYAVVLHYLSNQPWISSAIVAQHLGWSLKHIENTLVYLHNQKLIDTNHHVTQNGHHYLQKEMAGN
ncbi:MAG: metal ABC transporter permease [Candidatus Dependentiae bacterium]